MEELGAIVDKFEAVRDALSIELGERVLGDMTAGSFSLGTESDQAQE